MNHCLKCKNRNTLICNTCDNGSSWEEARNSFDLIISAVMFGCGVGGVLAAFYLFFV